MKEVSWFSPPGIGDAVGYGYAAVQTIRALQQAGIKVSFDQEGPLVHISFVQPEFYRGINEQYRVGYTPWESSALPESWPIDMRQMDEIWTTSQYCVDVFNDHNVNKIVRLVPHGIDPEIWKIENRFVSDKFVFLHVGGPTERKGGQRVVDAFLDLFGDNEDVALILKSNGDTECRYFENGVDFKSAKYHPRILVIDYKITTEDMANMYKAAHCLVYPTNGEGFGLIPFQGIATGLPTITTDATACADFAKLSVPLDSHPASGKGVHLGDWVEPDLNDLRDKMLYVYENFDSVKEKTLQSARVIHETQTWAKIGEQIAGILGEKVSERA